MKNAEKILIELNQSGTAGTAGTIGAGGTAGAGGTIGAGCTPDAKLALELLDKRIHAAAMEVSELLLASGRFLTTAESLTGGMIASSLVDIAGSSRFFSDGFVTYSDEAKRRRLGVPARIIELHTAVSPETALYMAQGALEKSGADYAVAVTGLAGPFVDENGAPYSLAVGHEPGLVFIAAAYSGGAVSMRRVFSGDRMTIRKKTNLDALLFVKKLMQTIR